MSGCLHLGYANLHSLLKIGLLFVSALVSYRVSERILSPVVDFAQAINVRQNQVDHG